MVSIVWVYPSLLTCRSAFAKNSIQVFVQTCFQVHVDEQRGLCSLGAWYGCVYGWRKPWNRLPTRLHFVLQHLPPARSQESSQGFKSSSAFSVILDLGHSKYSTGYHCCCNWQFLRGVWDQISFNCRLHLLWRDVCSSLCPFFKPRRCSLLTAVL